MSAGNQRVMVSVRVRPMLREGAHLQAQEKFELQAVYRTGDTALKVELTKPGEPAKSSMFTFDYIFDQESTQLEVYEEAVVDMIDAALVGINATMLAYGQTGSGKTFTVLGDVKPNPLENDLLTPHSGMFLRVLSDLMDFKIRQQKKGWHVIVGLSCVEIYNENIRDLFGGRAGQDPPTIKPIMLGDDVLLPGLTIKEMTTILAVFNEIQLAISRRKSRATEANAASSRSHCLFTIDVLQQANSAPPPTMELLKFDRKTAEEKSQRKTQGAPPASPTSKKGAPEQKLPAWEMPFQGTIYRQPGQKEPVYMSKIILADLAGSERIARSGVTGAGQTEAVSINSSLTALGNVVHSLHEGSYVSYRISNLTRMLKPTFSQPTSRVLLLAQCSPTQLTFDETISTLHFANKVKAMKVTTTTGAEAEKLQFDFLELEKTYDSILADLHIFSITEQTKPAVIRRRVTQHEGMYYLPNAGSKKISLKERRSIVESMGAVSVAQEERAAHIALKEKEKSEEAERIRQAVMESCKDMIEEFKTNITETQAAIKAQDDMRDHHGMQELLIDAAARRNQIEAEEGGEWATLNADYMKEHQTKCTREFDNITDMYEATSKEIGRMRLASALEDTPETAADNRQYALSTWGHCTAQRFFSSCMQLREDQMMVLSINQGNSALEKWKSENRDALKKFEDGTL